MEKFNRNSQLASFAMTTFCMAFILSCISFYVANAVDPPPLQQFCVGVNDYNSSVFINGKFCKNPNNVTMSDFLFKGFNIPGNTDNNQGSTALIINADLFPGLNTLGIGMGRIDFGPYGLNTPHLHPLASEMFLIVQGTLYVGFVTTDDKLIDGVAKKGDIVVFPQGLIHFQLNIGSTDALAIAAFGSQNPGRVNVPSALFGTTPPILSDVLTKGFQVSDRVIQQLQSQFSNGVDGIESGRSILQLFSQAT